MMLKWAERPPEVAHLLNPSFLGAVVNRAAEGYEEESGEGIPFALTFLAVPISLHISTRDALPRDLRTTMPTWLQRYPESRLGFDARVRSLAPFVKEGIRYALRNEVLRLDGAQLVAGELADNRRYAPIVTDELRSCLTKAKFVGRWFAQAGTPHTVYALWGVKP